MHDRGKSESFCLLTYYPFDGVDALHLLICNTIMNYKFITFVIHDTLARTKKAKKGTHRRVNFSKEV